MANFFNFLFKFFITHCTRFEICRPFDREMINRTAPFTISCCYNFVDMLTD